MVKHVCIAKSVPKQGRFGGLVIHKRTGKPVLIREVRRLNRFTATVMVLNDGWHYVPKKIWRRSRKESSNA